MCLKLMLRSRLSKCNQRDERGPQAFPRMQHGRTSHPWEYRYSYRRAGGEKWDYIGDPKTACFQT